MEPAHGAGEYGGMSSTAQLQAILWRMRAELERFVAEAGPARMELPGVTGDWSLKDVIAHLTFWRWWSVARLEAAVRNETPTPPWGSGLDEENAADVERINQQNHAANHDCPVADVLRDSRATFDRLEAALLALPEADLFVPHRYPWLGEYPAAAIILGSAGHLYEEHAPAIAVWLARGSGR